MKLDEFVRKYLPDLSELRDLQTAIPRIAKNTNAIRTIEKTIPRIPTKHLLLKRDARRMENIPDGSVHLIVTSPPYWNLKNYPSRPDQIGAIDDYSKFLKELLPIWEHCHRVLVMGGRLVVVVGDVCQSRRKHGRHSVVPLHASIQEQCRALGFDNLAPIIWHKITNARYEVENGSRFLGKPYEPNAIIKNDIEYILMQRKPGAYRRPSKHARILSIISEENHRQWFQQIWHLRGASTKNHPAPFPQELAERLIRMFSFVGDTVLDPFMGTGTTNLAAALWGRSSIGFDIEPKFVEMAQKRLDTISRSLFSSLSVEVMKSSKTIS